MEVGLHQTKQVLAVVYVLPSGPLRITVTLIQSKAMVSGIISCFKRNLAAYM